MMMVFYSIKNVTKDTEIMENLELKSIINDTKNSTEGLTIVQAGRRKNQ